MADMGSPGMGWGRLALGGVEIRQVPGDHVDMLHRPHVALLAEQLRECIDKAIGAELQTLREATPRSMPTDRAERLENGAPPEGWEEASGESQNRRA